MICIVRNLFQKWLYNEKVRLESESFKFMYWVIRNRIILLEFSFFKFENKFFCINSKKLHLKNDKGISPIINLWLFQQKKNEKPNSLLQSSLFISLYNRTWYHIYYIYHLWGACVLCSNVNVNSISIKNWTTCNYVASFENCCSRLNSKANF